MRPVSKGSPIATLSNRWFEILLVTVVLAVTLITHQVTNGSQILLHFYYLPVMIAAYHFGRRLAGFVAVLSVAVVAFFVMLDPSRHMVVIQSKWMLIFSLTAWAGFLGLNALLMGTLCDARARQMEELRNAHVGIIEILSKYLQAADHYTKSHSQRVAELAEEIAEEMGLPQDEIENVRVGALLHDIGKVEISTRLIQKAATLTEQEQSEMAAHTVRGAELVRSLGTILEGAVPVIMHHHDYWSTEGKDVGHHGETIPLGARIVSVADAYDAIITDRPYRRGRTPQEAVGIIREASGKQFDPKVVRAFERVMATRLDESDAPRAKRPSRETVGAGVA